MYKVYKDKEGSFRFKFQDLDGSTLLTSIPFPNEPALLTALVDTRDKIRQGLFTIKNIDFDIFVISVELNEKTVARCGSYNDRNEVDALIFKLYQESVLSQGLLFEKLQDTEEELQITPADKLRIYKRAFVRGMMPSDLDPSYEQLDYPFNAGQDWFVPTDENGKHLIQKAHLIDSH